MLLLLLLLLLMLLLMLLPMLLLMLLPAVVVMPLEARLGLLLPTGLLPPRLLPGLPTAESGSYGSSLPPPSASSRVAKKSPGVAVASERLRLPGPCGDEGCLPGEAGEDSGGGGDDIDDDGGGGGGEERFVRGGAVASHAMPPQPLARISNSAGRPAVTIPGRLHVARLKPLALGVAEAVALPCTGPMQSPWTMQKAASGLPHDTRMRNGLPSTGHMPARPASPPPTEPLRAAGWCCAAGAGGGAPGPAVPRGPRATPAGTTGIARCHPDLGWPCSGSLTATCTSKSPGLPAQ